jgi:hypothetical protein
MPRRPLVLLIVALNSNCGAGGSPSCDRESAQVRWLQADLAGNSRACTLAFWHHPRFTDRAGHADDPRTQWFWNALYADDGHYGVVHLTLAPTAWSSEFRRTNGQIVDEAAAGCWR